MKQASWAATTMQASSATSTTAIVRHEPAMQSHRRSASPWGRTSSLTAAINMLPIREDDAHRPNPRRLRRSIGRWLPLDDGTLFGRITVLRHGGHKRPVIHRGSKHLRFRYASAKTQCTQLGEGHGEQALAMYNEIATHIPFYITHPYEIELTVGGRLKRYRPDGVRQFVDGTVELYEVKRTRADLADPELRETLAQVKELARRSGWIFNVLFLKDILGTEARQTNVWSLFSRTSLDLSRHHSRIVGRLAGPGEPIAWGDLAHLLAPNDALHGDALIECLLAKGRLATDLDLELTPETILMPVRPFSGASRIEL